ncbi:MAG: hypothetical protein WKG07_10705 [Hymenobacter sp.]
MPHENRSPHPGAQSSGSVGATGAGLAHPGADCFIHLDRKADSRLFAALLPTCLAYTSSATGLMCAGVGIASLRQRWTGCGKSCKPLPLRGYQRQRGEDYPIKPLAAIHGFWAQHPGRSFLEYEAADSAWWQANGQQATQYHLTE